MEPDRVAYSPIIERPRLHWPKNARLALWIVPNVEFFEFLPPGPAAQRDPYPRCPHPDIMNYGLRDYGNRVGFWRLIDMLDKHSIRCTLSLNLAVYQHFPEIMQACESRGYDVMCHGVYNTNYLYDTTEREERAYIQNCVSTFRSLTGRDFTGWYSPAGSGTHHTPDLLAEAGVRYYVDWYHDDQPFPMKVRQGRLLSLPYSMDVNDGWNLRLNIDAEEFAFAVKDQFDQLYKEGKHTCRVMTLALHPWVMGQPHRIRHLDRLLTYILSHEDVWVTTGAEIADWFTQQHLPIIEDHIAAFQMRWGDRLEGADDDA